MFTRTAVELHALATVRFESTHKLYGRAGTSTAKRPSGCSGQARLRKRRPPCYCSPRRVTVPAISRTCSACGMRLNAAVPTLPSSSMERYNSCHNIALILWSLHVNREEGMFPWGQRLHASHAPCSRTGNHIVRPDITQASSHCQCYISGCHPSCTDLARLLFTCLFWRLQSAASIEHGMNSMFQLGEAGTALTFCSCSCGFMALALQPPPCPLFPLVISPRWKHGDLARQSAHVEDTAQLLIIPQLSHSSLKACEACLSTVACCTYKSHVGLELSTSTSGCTPEMRTSGCTSLIWQAAACALQALKNFLAVDKHFADFVEDQFDFHSYCTRKMTLRAYIAMLRTEDDIYHNPYFFKVGPLSRRYS